jgi:putative copper resistance protein D
VPDDLTGPAVILLRLVQYSAASILMGSALFFVYALPAQGPGSAATLRWGRPLLLGAAVLLAVGTLLGLVAQTAVLAGSWSDALTADSLTAVVTQMDLGKAALARAALALAAAICVALMPRGRALWWGAGLLGTLAAATFGWMGHGVATEGGGHELHLIADVLHALAAAAWVGALTAFVGLLAPRRQAFEALAATADALRRFSPVGIALVATLVVTGLVNGWYLVGTHVAMALHDPYGQLLALKLVLFAGMLALAALHRQRSVPALAARIAARTMPQGDALASLRRSMLAEALLGFLVLAIVAWFGTLEPPMAM